MVVGDAVYLVDCGEGVHRQLWLAGLTVSGRFGSDRPIVRALFVTHLHSDHIMDLANLAQGSWPTHKIDAFGPAPAGLPIPAFPLGDERPLALPVDPTPGLRGTIEHLRTQRDPTRVATAYRSAHDGLPEPLCAIFEPRARGELEAAVAMGRMCPRKFLSQSDALLLELPDARALDNVNTREEFDAAAAQLGRKERTSKTVRVQYYAILREQAGRNDETLDTSAANAVSKLARVVSAAARAPSLTSADPVSASRLNSSA